MNETIQATVGRRPVLDGITVLDFTTAMSGPYCTRQLADLGAEVIKIEPPGGELGRNSAPFRDGRSTVFGQLNCGKRSVVFDLKKEEDVALVRRLAETADVVVENFRPDVMDRLGLGYETLASINPRLIFCSINGFGPEGPAATYPAFAPVVQAMSGYEMALWDYQDGLDRPLNSAIFFADVFAGANAFAAILAALIERQTSGLGQRVGTTLLDGVLSLLAREVQEAQLPPGPRRHLYKPLRSADGFLVVMPLTNKNFQGMCTVMERPDLLSDERFATPGGRASNWDALMAETEAWTSTRPGAEGEARFAAAGVPCGRYRTVRDVLGDPVLGAIVGKAEIQDGQQRYDVTTAPFKLGATPARPRPWVSEIDEHGGAVRGDLT